MSASADAVLFGGRVLHRQRRRGNVLIVYGEGDDARLLKLYRRRRSRARELSRDLSHRWFEGKQGVDPATRCATERRCLEVWSRHGFDVFRRFEAPLPPGAAPPANWLEYRRGALLSHRLRDAHADLARREALLRRFATELGRRQRRALELGEPLLIQENASLKHVLVSGERLIHFDFETAYRADFPLLDAAARELGGHLRGLSRASGRHFDAALALFVDAYADRDLLRRAAERAVRAGGLVRPLRRWQDRLRRPRHAKTEVMERLLAAL